MSGAADEAGSDGSLKKLGAAACGLFQLKVGAGSPFESGNRSAGFAAVIGASCFAAAGAGLGSGMAGSAGQRRAMGPTLHAGQHAAFRLSLPDARELDAAAHAGAIGVAADAGREARRPGLQRQEKCRGRDNPFHREAPRAANYPHGGAQRSPHGDVGGTTCGGG